VSQDDKKSLLRAIISDLKKYFRKSAPAKFFGIFYGALFLKYFFISEISIKFMI
jgi:hypothetical protein